MKSVRTLGVASLLLAAVACATGLWWYGLTTRRADLIEERAASEVASAEVRSADVLVSQAVVFALDGAEGRTDFDDVDRIRAFAAEAVVDVRPGSVISGDVAQAVDDFRTEALDVTEALARGDLDGARDRHAGQLASARARVDRTIEQRIVAVDGELAAVAATTGPVSVLSVALGVMALSGIGATAMAAAGRRRMEKDEQPSTEPALQRAPSPDAEDHIVIQLPTGPNTLTQRRRHPKVEDLGWLVGEVMKPYRARGWDLTFESPMVGADCDPADVREVLNMLLSRADAGEAERICIGIQPAATRVRVVVADDGSSIFGPDGYLSASEPVRLRSSVRTRTEADTAELTWSRADGWNVAILDLPRLGIVVPIGAEA